MAVVVMVNVIRRSYFAMKLRESEKHILDKGNCSWGSGER